MQLVTVDLANPQPGEVRIKHAAIGLNYIDTYHRSGLYAVNLPFGLGQEAVGVVEEVGQGVTTLKVGGRVAYGNGLRRIDGLAQIGPCRLYRCHGSLFRAISR